MVLNLTFQTVKARIKSKAYVIMNNVKSSKYLCISIGASVIQNDYHYDHLIECIKHMSYNKRIAFIEKSFKNKSVHHICQDLEIEEKEFWNLIHQARTELMNTQFYV